MYPQNFYKIIYCDLEYIIAKKTFLFLTVNTTTKCIAYDCKRKRKRFLAASGYWHMFASFLPTIQKNE